MHAQILEGLRNDEFNVVYQPQMLADGVTMGSVEALVRWTAGDGPVPLNLFLAVAEQTGAIVDIGSMVLLRACLDTLNWPGLRVAVNVSAMQLRSPHFAETIEHIVNAAGLPFDRLELELVESTFLENFDIAERNLSRLRQLGCTIALDDFGTGFSSLAYLCKLPLDKVKIDRSFIANVDKVQSAAIVQAMVALARALGLKVAAEGVETVEQQRFVKACGVHFMQGFLFSRPVAAEEITRMRKAAVAA